MCQKGWKGKQKMLKFAYSSIKKLIKKGTWQIESDELYSVVEKNQKGGAKWKRLKR